MESKQLVNAFIVEVLALFSTLNWAWPLMPLSINLMMSFSCQNRVEPQRRGFVVVSDLEKTL